MRMPPHSMMPRDTSMLDGASVGRQTARRVWTFARPYRFIIAVFVTAIVVAALLALVPPLVVRAILDTAIPQADRRLIVILALFAVVAALADAGLQILQRWCSAHIGEGLIADLRCALFDKVQHLPVAFFTHTPTGAITSRLNNDVVGAQTAVTSTLGSIVSNVVVLITTLIAMLALEWRLTLLALVVLPLFAIPARRVGRRLQEISRQQMQHNAAMNTQMTERFNISGAMLVMLFGDKRRELDAFARQADQVRDAGVRSAMLGRIFFVALGLVAAMGTAAIYGVGAILVVDGAITTGTLVALAALATRVYQPLTGLTNARVDLMTSLVSFDRVFEVLDAPEPITDRPGAIDLVAPRGRITFSEVGFRYPRSDSVAIASMEQVMLRPDGDTADDAAADAGDDTGDDGRSAGSQEHRREVLRGIDLDIAPGETIALVGASGAGKSTMTALIPRLYDVTAGSLRIDDVDVRDLTVDSLRAAIGVVPQDPHLFHESIGDNLRYARPDASDADLESACRAARIHEVIAALPDGYDTVVGERGYRLSGGEKQRLAIARLLLKDPVVVILDEATSHLDNENEASIQAALDNALDGRTAIVIAHRLSTVRTADRIAVIDSGRIVEIGTHDELSAAGGVYSAQLRAGELLETS